MLEAIGLTCVKKDRCLFTDLSFVVEAGHLLYITGPNGAGKTSLLRLLVGLSEPESGQIRFNHQPLSSDYFQQLIYIGHRSGINLQLSALENLQFWCAQHACQVSKDDCYQVLAQLGLVGLEDLPCGQLSAGQQRRAALARLWLKPARLWVLDEPYTALDTHGIALLNQHIQQHIEAGGAVVMTSHQQPVLSVSVRQLALEYLI